MCIPSEKQNLGHLGALANGLVVPRGEAKLGGTVIAMAEKFVKEMGRVGGASCRLGVELRREDRLARVHDSFIASIIGVGEERLPVCRRRHEHVRHAWSFKLVASK